MASTVLQSADEPIATINTTPLIDVMLVLLIMFVITIPVATRQIPVDLPAATDGGTEFNAIKNRVVVTPSGDVLWNGRTVSQERLADLLAISLRQPVEPELQFAPDPAASYDRSAHVLATIKDSGVTRFGFVDNDRHATFDK